MLIFFSRFPIIWNGFRFLSFTLSCPVHPPPSAHGSISLLHKSFDLVPVFLSVSWYLCICPSSHMSVPLQPFLCNLLCHWCHFTDPLTCSFLILSFLLRNIDLSNLLQTRWTQRFSKCICCCSCNCVALLPIWPNVVLLFYSWYDIYNIYLFVS